MYEIQPIRFSKTQPLHILQQLKNVLSTVVVVIRSIPKVVVTVFTFLRSLESRHWMLLGGMVLYYYFVRWMHDLLEAGPLVIITTCLALIFTIGLGDNDDRDGLSAYAVFNRGFERLLGSVDVEALMAQHVGIAGGGGGGGMMGAVPIDDHEHAGGRRRQRPPRVQEGVVDQRNDTERNDGAPNNNRARKSGKKARRRDLAQRREIQNQRQAAAALGMQMGNDALEEQVAMQRLIEEQIAADHQ